ncbi:MAG: hypothetical protein KIT40_03045 [Nitrospira sp.]|nr:hypothetical protein [Nitrospira sp.]
MPSNNTTSLLNFALQQMVAESYLQGIDWHSALQVRPRLLLGNNNMLGVDPAEAALTGNTRFTGVLVERFLNQYDIIDHHANDATGFSATLMRDKTTGEYTLSFRSTEAKHQDAGGDWERDGLPGADGEIAGTGFALAQLVSMEKYYRALKADPAKLPAGALLNVTGYSLGGHLATVFTELHANEVQATYTFNGAGRGRINGGMVDLPEVERIREMLQQAEMQLDAIDSAWFNSGNMENVYADQRYRAVRQSIVLGFNTTNSFLPPGEIGTGPGFGRITQLVGAATHNDAFYVANSGVHATPTTIFIEDQPDVDSSSIGTTHSITLIVDSLALNELFHNIDGSLQRSTVEEIFAASSSQSASGFVGMSGVAEGDSLEKALDVLGDIFVQNYTPTLFGREAHDFGNLTFRNSFYDNIQAVKAAVGGETYQIVSVASKSSSEIFAAARQTDAAGFAYRYALRELNPFVVTGVDYLALHNQDHSLDLYDASTGVGAWTQMALNDRAELLAEKLRFNQANGTPVSQTLFVDETTFFQNLRGATATEAVIFGDAEGREYVGRRGNDHIYGGAGEDTIRGAEGKDYLEGGDGNDRIFGEAENDTLVGQQGEDFLDGGRGADYMTGGVGDDIYIVDNPGDRVVEFEGGGIDQVQADVSFALSTNVERLILTGSGNIAGIGNDLDNMITGNSGNNQLTGMGGNDLLEGGIGFDTYTYHSGDGMDQIEDSDARGQIIFDDRLLQGSIRRAGDAGNTYTSLDGRTTYVMSGTDLIVNGVLIVNENFQSGQMGIQLRDVSGMPHDTGIPTRSPQDVYIGGGEAETFSPGLGATEIHANGGNDVLFGDTVSVFGGAFDDLLDGGSGNDVFIGGFGDDYLIGGSGNDYAILTEGDMFLGGDGDDYAVGVADFWDSTGLRIDGGGILCRRWSR